MPNALCSFGADANANYLHEMQNFWDINTKSTTSCYHVQAASGYLGLLGGQLVLGNLDGVNVPGLAAIGGSHAAGGGVGQGHGGVVLGIGLVHVEGDVGPAVGGEGAAAVVVALVAGVEHGRLHSLGWTTVSVEVCSECAWRFSYRRTATT